MDSRQTRMLSLAGGILMLWIVTIAILLQVIPGPHRNVDYLVIGAVATFLSMILLFIVLLQGWVKSSEVFGTRRAKDGDDPPETGPTEGP